jgi:two-component system sensor histidine kinase ComP
VAYTLQRGSETIDRSMTVGSRADNRALFAAHVGTFILALAFWATGLVLCLFAPMHDARTRLIGMVWLVGGVAMAAGGPGTACLFWGAYTTLEVSWSVLAFLIVTAHLYFPAPVLGPRRRHIAHAFLAIALLLSALVVVEDWVLGLRGLSLPRIHRFSVHSATYTFFFISVLIAVVLLLFSSFVSRDGEVRRQTRIILWGTVLGFGPLFSLTLLPWLLFGPGTEYLDAPYSVLFLVLIPLAYAYVIYQRKLLRVDLVINRLVVSFVLVLLIVAVSIVLLGLVSLAFRFPAQVPLVGGILAALIALPSPALHRAVHRRVNRVLYGCHYDFATVTVRISSELAQTVDRESLTRLLTESLPGQMGIRRAQVFLREDDALVLQQLAPCSIATDDQVCRVLLEGQMPVRAERLWSRVSAATREQWQPFAWVHLFVPLVLKERLMGVLILGARRSGSVYSEQDFRIVGTAARHGALAYENVLLVEKLRGLNRELVRMDEARRKRMVSNLHDTVLQQMFFIKQGLLHRQDHFHAELIDGAIRGLRHTIKEQRPPLLDQGLELALQSLVADAQEMVGDSPVIVLRNTLTARPGLSDEEATALYRIVQESLTNALKHAHAQTIVVEVTQDGGAGIRLCVDDDGVGIPAGSWGTEARDGHYGLVGVQERAAMVGAQLDIVSTPGEGTRIEVEL